MFHVGLPCSGPGWGHSGGTWRDFSRWSRSRTDVIATQVYATAGKRQKPNPFIFKIQSYRAFEIAIKMNVCYFTVAACSIII